MVFLSPKNVVKCKEKPKIRRPPKKDEKSNTHEIYTIYDEPSIRLMIFEHSHSYLWSLHTYIATTASWSRDRRKKRRWRWKETASLYLHGCKNHKKKLSNPMPSQCWCSDSSINPLNVQRAHIFTSIYPRSEDHHHQRPQK